MFINKYTKNFWKQLEFNFDEATTTGGSEKDDKYRNASGDLLPWEEPDWIAQHRDKLDNA